MSTSISLDEPYGAYERAYNVEMLQTQVFGAFFSVVEYRRSTVKMTNAEIARRGGWDRSAITKNLGAPSNWTLKTISELATALDVDFKFVLVDRTDRSRNFDSNGLLFDFTYTGQGSLMGEPQIQANFQRSGQASSSTTPQIGFADLFRLDQPVAVNCEIPQQ